MCINLLTVQNYGGPEKGLIEALPIIDSRVILQSTIHNALSLWCASHPLALLNAEGSRESYQKPYLPSMQQDVAIEPTSSPLTSVYLLGQSFA